MNGGDVWVSQGADGGYHLYIRKKPDISSILLVETTRDPALLEPNYAYRTNSYNSINGDELRIIDGKLLPQSSGWSLIDSTPEFIPEIGIYVFHIYIPFLIQYGYPWTRNGEVYVGNGTYFNIRAFTLPYADYNGFFQDNPFILEITQEPLPGPPALNYMKDTEDAFERISRKSGGLLIHSSGPDDIVETIGKLISDEAGQNLDIVLCLDTTASMRNDIAALRTKLIDSARGFVNQFKSFRVGMVLFRDYNDAYLTKIIPWTSDLNKFQQTLNGVQAAGGRDIPEAVHEGLYEAITKFQWRDAKRIVILIGDAPPHIKPRGNISENMVLEAANAANVYIHSIVLPQ